MRLQKIVFEVAEVRGQGSGDRGQESGDRSQETGVRGQETGVSKNEEWQGTVRHPYSKAVTLSWLKATSFCLQPFSGAIFAASLK